MKNLTRKHPSWRRDGEIDVLMDRAMHTRHHLHADGLPSECETKNNLSAESIMLVTSALIGGIGCGIALATSVGGRPVCITGLSSMASKEKYCSCSALSIHRNGSDSLLSSDNIGKWKSWNLPVAAKWAAALKGWGGVKTSISAFL